MAAVMVLFSRGGAHLDNIATNAGNATPWTNQQLPPFKVAKYNSNSKHKLNIEYSRKRAVLTQICFTEAT